MFRVWLSADSALAVSGPITVHTRDARIHIINQLEVVRSNLPPVHTGLAYQVDLGAKSPREAMDRAIAECERANDLLSATHSVSIREAVPKVALETTIGVSDRLFAQFERDLALHARPRRHFSPDEFRRSLEALETLSEPERERVHRAFHLLRRGYWERDPVDRFEDVWGALEVMNPLLQQKHRLPKSFPGKKCQRCGHQSLVPGQSSGIRHCVEKLAEGTSAQWNRLLTVRKDIVHGLRPPREFGPEMDDLFPLARRALVLGIGDVLGLSKAALERWERQFLGVLQGPDALLTVTMRGFPDSCLGEGALIPVFDISLSEEALVGDPSVSGRKEMTFKVKATGRNIPGTYDEAMVELWVSKDPEDRSATLEVIEKRVVRPDGHVDVLDS